LIVIGPWAAATRADPLYTAQFTGPVYNDTGVGPPDYMYIVNHDGNIGLNDGRFFDDNGSLLQGFRTDASPYNITQLYESGKIHPLPGDTGYTLMGINNEGHAIGHSYVGTDPRYNLPNPDSGPLGTKAFFYSPALGTVGLQTASGPLEFAFGINNSDQIVGESHAVDGSLHGFFLPSPTSQAIDLNDVIGPHPGYTIIAADAINNSGQIVGYAKDANGINHFVTLDPISANSPVPAPEPSSALVLGMCVAGLLGYARYRRRDQ
jgi:hypothetical protein